MQDIEELGREIEYGWRNTQYQPEEFASIAQAALEKRTLSATTSIEQLFRWFLASPQIPHQPPNANFGEPSIQLYAGRRFYIEALFWTDGTTAIHQHSFSGAFQVLVGGSIHTTYAFERKEMINRDLLLGDLVAGCSELLRAGDVRRIVSGGKFIHSLFHLDRPSVTLVVRTKRDAGIEPQYSYLHPGIAYDPFVPDERSSRLLRLVDLLEHRSLATMKLLAEVAETADLSSVVALLMRWFRIHPVAPDAADGLLDIVARRHGALAISLRGAIREARRQALIISRRQKHHRPEHRFFLSLLLNVGNRAQILRFVEQRYPDADPIDCIMAWTQELLAPPASPREQDNAVPVEYDLGEAELKVLRYLLQQRTPSQVVEALTEEYDGVEAQRPHILQLCTSLSTSALFQPLFRM